MGPSLYLAYIVAICVEIRMQQCYKCIGKPIVCKAHSRSTSTACVACYSGMGGMLTPGKILKLMQKCNLYRYILGYSCTSSQPDTIILYSIMGHVGLISVIKWKISRPLVQHSSGNSKVDIQGRRCTA